MARIALGVEYDGAAHYGWQRQRELPSVQGYLDAIIHAAACQKEH